TLLLIYLCVVLYVALRSEKGTVFLCTLCCFMGFAFFQTVPLLNPNLTVTLPEEALTAVLFVVIGTLAGTIATQLRSQFTSLQEQKEFVHQQLALSQALHQLDDA